MFQLPKREWRKENKTKLDHALHRPTVQLSASEFEAVCKAVPE